MLICCATLCVTLTLFCVAALATDLQVKVEPVDAKTVDVAEKTGGADRVFTVTKDGVKAGDLYLVLIQKLTQEGAKATDKPKPTEENIYYIDVKQADNSTLSIDATPRDMDEGSYAVYLSDWSDSGNGAAKGVATITLSAATSGGGGGGSSGGSEGGTTPGGEGGSQKLGDVNNDTYIDGSDAYCVMRIFAGMKNGNKDWTPEELAAAHVNDDEYVDGSDALLIMQHFAGLLDDNFKRK